MTADDDSGRTPTVTPDGSPGSVHVADILDYFLPAVNNYALDPVTLELVGKWYRMKDDAERGELTRMVKAVRATDHMDASTVAHFGVPVPAPSYLVKALWPAAARKKRAYLMADSWLSQLAGHLDAEVGRRKAAPPRAMAALGAIQFVCDRNHAEYERIINEYEAAIPVGGTPAEKERRRRDVLRLHFDEIWEKLETWAETNETPAGIDPYSVTYWAGQARLGRGAIPMDGVLQDFEGIQREHDALRRRAEHHRQESDARGHYGGRPPLPGVIEPHRQGLEQALVLVKGIFEKRPGASFEVVFSEGRAEAQKEGRRPPSRTHMRQAFLSERSRRGT